MTVIPKNIVLGVMTFSLTTLLAPVVEILLHEKPAPIRESIYPRDRTDDVLQSVDRAYDFVIVGGGSAGSVLASRITEMSNCSVLLIERGDDPDLISEIPLAQVALPYTEMTYDFVAQPQAGACLSANGGVCKWIRGKGLGGSSIINAMLYSTGNKRDYDDWAAAGNEGWSYEEVKYYFKKSQQMQPDYIARHGTNEFGAHGPLSLRNSNSSLGRIRDNFLEATKSLGYPILEAFSASDQMGFGRSHGTLDGERRVNVAKAYLAPAKDRVNLSVMKGARADKVVIENHVTRGVEVTLRNGRRLTVWAKKEVILSAGSIGTPQLLMLSGIGPAAHVREMGIDVIADLPVGKNLQDHVTWPSFLFCYRNNSRPSLFVQLAAGAIEYATGKTGPFSELAGTDIMGFINVDNFTASHPNIQIATAVFPARNFLVPVAIGAQLGLDTETIRGLQRILGDNECFPVFPVFLRPKSVGRLELKSARPDDTMLIYPNYLTDESDVDTILKSVDFAKRLAGTEAFKRDGVRMEVLPVPKCNHHATDSRDFWECHLRHTGGTAWHPVGTAKMGPRNDSTTVVDPHLRVHGISRLRVADASIMPDVTSGNTNGPVVMIAEKASDLIKATYAHSNTGNIDSRT